MDLLPHLFHEKCSHAWGWGGGVVMLTFLALAHLVQQMAGGDVQTLRMAKSILKFSNGFNATHGVGNGKLRVRRLCPTDFFGELCLFLAQTTSKSTLYFSPQDVKKEAHFPLSQNWQISIARGSHKH